MTSRVIQIIPLVGALLVPVAMRAQCAPAVQQLLTKRKYDVARDRKSTRLNSSHMVQSRMPSSA